MSIIAPTWGLVPVRESVTVAGAWGASYYALPWSQGGISSFQASGQRMRERDGSAPKSEEE